MTSGMVFHLATGGVAVGCPNNRPLALLSVADMLFAKLLSKRIAGAVCLHVQRHACRPGRGTLNPAQKMLGLCGNAPRQTTPRMPAFLKPQKLTTRYRTLFCSAASFIAESRIPPGQFFLFGYVLIGIQQCVLDHIGLEL